MKLKHIAVVASAAIALASTAATAQTTPVKCTADVCDTIKLLSVVVSPSTNLAEFTYEALKNCPSLAVFGHTYTKDDIQGGVVGLSNRRNVRIGQKFKDRTAILLDPGGYIALEKAYCR